MSRKATEFDGLADGYQRHRPSYPDETVRIIVQSLTSTGTSGHHIDLGAGTGILTRLLHDALPATWQITAIEPGEDMRRVAIAANDGRSGIRVIDGSAEALDIENASMNGISVAQALHWFDRPAFYAEANRVLKPGGCLAIIYNERDNTDPLLARFEDELETVSPGYRRDYRSFPYAEELEHLAWVADCRSHAHPWHWELTPEAFAGLMISRSKTNPWVKVLGASELKRHLIAMAEEFAAPDGLVALPYRTDLTIATKR